MNKQISSVQVKALQAYTRDVGGNIARVDPKTMDALGISTGGALAILGQRKTVSKCMPLYSSDLGKNIMRIDGMIRENAGLEIGDAAELKKSEPLLAENACFAPVSTMKVNLDPQYIIETLSGKPIGLGDSVMIPYGLEWKIFILLGASPHSESYVIGEKTQIELLPSIVWS
jgi:transitional endoplasmic reticulum ATPase